MSVFRLYFHTQYEGGPYFSEASNPTYRGRKPQSAPISRPSQDLETLAYKAHVYMLPFTKTLGSMAQDVVLYNVMIQGARGGEGGGASVGLVLAYFSTTTQGQQYREYQLPLFITQRIQ